jgi:hypothetical protein
MIKLMSREEKAEVITAAVEKLNAGLTVDVTDASYSAYSLCIGDFRDMGWSEKITWRTGMQWQWTGPGKINMSGETLATGDFSQEVDMDWS